MIVFIIVVFIGISNLAEGRYSRGVLPTALSKQIGLSNIVMKTKIGISKSFLRLLAAKDGKMKDTIVRAVDIDRIYWQMNANISPSFDFTDVTNSKDIIT